MYTYLRAHLSHIPLSATRSARSLNMLAKFSDPPAIPPARALLHFFASFALPGHSARLRSRPAIGAACPADRHTAPSHGRLRPLRNGYNRSRLGRGRARDTPIPGTTHLPSSEWNVPYPIGFDVLRTAAINSDSHLPTCDPTQPNGLCFAGDGAQQTRKRTCDVTDMRRYVCNSTECETCGRRQWPAPPTVDAEGAELPTSPALIRSTRNEEKRACSNPNPGSHRGSEAESV